MMNDFVCPHCRGSLQVAGPREYRMVERDGKKFVEMWFEPASPTDVQRLQMLVYDPFSSMGPEEHPSVKYPLVGQWDSVPIPGHPQEFHRRVCRIMLDPEKLQPVPAKESPAKAPSAASGASDDLTHASKPFLLEEAQKTGVECDETWTRPKLMEAIRAKRKTLVTA